MGIGGGCGRRRWMWALEVDVVIGGGCGHLRWMCSSHFKVL